MAVDAAANLYVSLPGANIIQMVSPSGAITTIAGNGKAGFSGDGGKATDAELDLSLGVKVDAAGNLYVADSANNRIRKITAQGMISTIAGNGKTGFSGDNVSAINTSIQTPFDVAAGAPGMAAGYFQVAVQVPSSAPTGAAIPIVLMVGGVASQPGVTISVQ